MYIILFFIGIAPYFLYFWLLPPKYKEGSYSQKLEDLNPAVSITRSEAMYCTVLRLIFTITVTVIVISIFDFSFYAYCGFFFAVLWFSNRLPKETMIARQMTKEAKNIDLYFKRKTKDISVNKIFFSLIIPVFIINYGFSLLALYFTTDIESSEKVIILSFTWILNQIIYSKITLPWFSDIYKYNQSANTAYRKNRELEIRNKNKDNDIHDIDL